MPTLVAHQRTSDMDEAYCRGVSVRTQACCMLASRVVNPTWPGTLTLAAYRASLEFKPSVPASSLRRGDAIQGRWRYLARD